VTARTRAIYIVNPHNPTGAVSETVPFKAFLTEMAKRTTVIVDEAYLEFEYDFARKTAVELTRSGALSWCSGPSERSTGWPGCRWATRLHRKGWLIL
jgi:aspartate/methionine/tyrosine aminotransferase